MKVRLIAVALLACASLAAMAQDPSIHEVYQAADRGQLVEAQRMMAQVLKDHPGSAKAHFVEAELLVRQGQIAQARAELAQADRLQPGLPFAQPAAVSALRAKLSAQTQPVQGARMAWAGAPVPAPAPHLPWGLIIAGVALAGLAFAWMRSRSASQPGAIYSGPAMPADRPFGGGMGSYGGAPYAGGPMPGSGGGLGSQMLGGLATGAAVGAGVVAGEALMHRIMGDDQRSGLVPSPGFDAAPVYEPQPDPSYDMGGQDFGLNDAGSWDDGGSAGGGDDWN